MARAEAGSRVGAISHTTSDNKVYFFGWGTYVGDEPCPLLDGMKNPMIRLEDGGVVWGCECWWGSEKKIRDTIGVREIVMVPVPDRGEVTVTAGQDR